jgi:hypothetical protein
MNLKYAVLNVTRNTFVPLDNIDYLHTSDFETANAVFEDLVVRRKSEEFRLVKVETLH